MSYRIGDQDRRVSIEALLRREMDDTFGASAIRWLPVRTATGMERAFGCWVGARGDLVAEGKPPEVVADVLPRACGPLGSNAEYLFSTVTHIEGMGIHYRNLWKLQKLVAKQIRKLYLRK